MTLERDIDVLSRVPFFADVPAEPLKLLAFSAEARDLGDRATLFSKGESAEGGYVVMSGQIDLVEAGRDGPRVLLSLGPGALIGEIALVVDTDRPATAIAVGRTKVVAIRRTTFRRVLEEYPEVAMSLHRRFAERIGGLEAELGDIITMLDEPQGP